MLAKVIHITFDFLFPPACFGCKKRGTPICDECLGPLLAPPARCFFCLEAKTDKNICKRCLAHYGLDGIFWTLAYHDPLVKKLIASFKYGRKKYLAGRLGELLLRGLKKEQLDPLLVIPIPLHEKKEKVRGFNQAELLAREAGFDLQKFILKRVRDTPSQARILRRSERTEKIRGAFHVQDGKKVTGKNILLIDDVATTGSTLSEAARTLKKAGAGKVYGLVLAHG
ncbi:MAG: ComF family protein [Candidatus Ryanbacteria bacterium]|nr:ComF family protein [Candidatus Ryanbacteria bacterium]